MCLLLVERERKLKIVKTFFKYKNWSNINLERVPNSFLYNEKTHIAWWARECNILGT